MAGTTPRTFREAVWSLAHSLLIVVRPTGPRAPTHRHPAAASGSVSFYRAESNWPPLLWGGPTPAGVVPLMTRFTRTVTVNRKKKTSKPRQEVDNTTTIGNITFSEDFDPKLLNAIRSEMIAAHKAQQTKKSSKSNRRKKNSKGNRKKAAPKLNLEAMVEL